MRTFIAIELPDDIKRKLARLQTKLTRFDSALRWTQPEHMHLTMRFIGDIDDHRIPGLCRALDDAASQCTPFEIAITGAGC